METYKLVSSTVHIALFHSLANAASLRQRLVTASTAPGEEGEAARDAVDFAFVDASAITSRLHLLTAIEHALIAQADGTLKTNSLPGEVLWFLEPGTNISESLRHFGLNANTVDLILVHFTARDAATDEGDVYRKMEAVVEGVLGSLDDLGASTNLKALRKLYKLNQDAVLMKVSSGSAEERKLVDELCISTIGLKAAA